MSAFKIVSYLSAIAVYALIIIGGYVSSSGSGLACPDWPLCHGQIIPPLSLPVLIEYTHRLWTLVVTVLVVSTMLLAWKTQRRKPTIAAFSTLTFTLLVVQIMLGAFTVHSALQPTVVTAHLGLATGVFASALITAASAHMLT